MAWTAGLAWGTLWLAPAALAADLPEELPVATDLHASPKLTYGGKAQGYNYGARVTFTVPRDELFEEFFSGSGIDPFYCSLERQQGSMWVEVVSPAFCQPFELGWADVRDLEPSTAYTFRVVLYQDQGDGNQNYIRKSPPSATVTMTSFAPGTPDLASTCQLSFGLAPQDGTVPLAWKLDAGGKTVESYELQRTDEPGGTWMTVATPAHADEVFQKYRDEGLSTSGDYYYRVRAAFSGGGTSNWSAIIKDRATADRDWCDLDRAAHDGAADAVGSTEWPGTGDGTGGSAGGNGGGSGGGASGGESSSSGGGPGGPGALGGAGGAGAGEDGATGDGCSCSVPGVVGTSSAFAWPLLALAGVFIGRRRRRA